MKRFLFCITYYGILTIGLLGCATVDPEVRDWNRHMDRLDWEECQIILHNGHRAEDHKHREQHWMVLDDLARNNCPRNWRRMKR